MFNYVYVTTNLINGKQYVGDHSTNNLNDGYLGSGILLQKAIKKYGKEKFRKEIIENFSSKKEAFDNQKKYIQEYNTMQPNGYNISPKGGHQCKNSMSDETKHKISKNVSKKLKGKIFSEEHKRNLSKAAKNKKITEKYKEHLRKIRIGKLHSEETKQKMKEIRKNKTYEEIYGEKRATQIKQLQSEINKGEKNPMYKKHPWNKGKNIKVRIEKCKYCGIEMPITHLNRYHNENCKNKKI